MKWNSMSFLCVFVVLLQVSCVTSKQESGESKRTISSEAVSETLNTTSAKFPEYQFFQSAIANPSSVSFASLMEKYTSLSNQSSELANLYRNYSTRVLNIDPENLEAWLENKHNERLRRGVMYYIDDPGNMDVPYWVVINSKLRSGEALTSDERQVKDAIVWSLERMPQISGVVFRGIKMRPDRYEALKQLVGQEYTESGFTSTSISPDIARRFGKVFESDIDKNRVETLWIMKIKRGGAVSYFHYDFNMFEELEALILPGSKYRVTGHFIDENRKEYPRAIFLMEQVD